MDTAIDFARHALQKVQRVIFDHVTRVQANGCNEFFDAAD